MGLTFTPLSGSAKSEDSTPISYLLEIDDVKILLDCGARDWTTASQAKEGLRLKLEQAEKEDVKLEGEEQMDVKPTEAELEMKMEEEQTEELSNAGRDVAESSTKIKIDETYEQTLERLAPSIDLVLLSHASQSHSGLFAYARANWGLVCPAYSTLAVQTMSRIATLESTLGWNDEQDLAEVPDALLATPDQIHEAFDHIEVLRYSQPKHLAGKLKTISLTAFGSGHTIGGTLWRIKSTAGVILYAVDMNHVKERHLDGTVLLPKTSTGKTGVLEGLGRPALLITDARRANVLTPKRRDRDTAMLNLISETLNEGSSLLFPCDASTRVLELIVMLDTYWTQNRIQHPLILVSRTGKELLEKVKSMMEWFGGGISDLRHPGLDPLRAGQNGYQNDGGPLSFRNLLLFPSFTALRDAIPSSAPKVVLAVPPSLSHGPARRLFSEFAQSPSNVVIMTGRGESSSLGRQLFDDWNARQTEGKRWRDGSVGDVVQSDLKLEVTLRSKIALVGEELADHLAAEKARIEIEEAQKAAKARAQRALEADAEVDSDSENDNEDEDENDVATALQTGNDARGLKRRFANAAEVEDPNNAVSFDIYLKGFATKNTSFFKNSNTASSQRFRMFPFIEKRRLVGEFGQEINLEAWALQGKIAEEREKQAERERDGKRQRLEDADRKIILEPPSKYVKQTLNLHVVCKMLFIDMQGLNDGKAVKTILPQVNPRKMILVSSSEAASSELLTSFQASRSMTKDIYCPCIGEPVQIGEYTHSYPLKIGDRLLSSLTFNQFEEFGIAHVEGQFTYTEESEIPTLDLPVSDSTSLQLTEGESDSRALVAGFSSVLPLTLYIGDLRLTKLKDQLIAAGLQAQLMGEGVLMCGREGGNAASVVAIRKTGKGKILLQGNASGKDDVYHAVRDQVYKAFAAIT